MARLALGQVGCGGMGLRHVRGLIEARRHGLERFDLVALCDLHPDAARRVADEAEQDLGRRPKIYTDFAAMLRDEPGLDAVNVVTDTRMHHVFAIAAFEAGKHVAVEKPMALTIRAGRRMIDAAEKAERVLSISENFRREPPFRLAKAALDAGLVGAPRLVIDLSTMGTRTVLQAAAWRHLKIRGGWLLEHAVHDADLLMYLLGPIESVFAETRIWETTRSNHEDPDHAGASRLSLIARSYDHRVKEPLDEAEGVHATAEDTAIAVLRFASGAVGQLGLSVATPGESLDLQMIYGSEGSLRMPRNRTGLPVQVTPFGRVGPLTTAELLAEVPDFRLDDATARLFGDARACSYELPFDAIDRKLIATEMTDFADAIAASGPPEVTGQAGLDALALVYALLEAGQARQPVSLQAVADDLVNAYQQEINEVAAL